MLNFAVIVIKMAAESSNWEISDSFAIKTNLNPGLLGFVTFQILEKVKVPERIKPSNSLHKTQ